MLSNGVSWCFAVAVICETVILYCVVGTENECDPTYAGSVWMQKLVPYDETNEILRIQNVLFLL